MTKPRVRACRVRVIFRSTQIPVPAYLPQSGALIGMWSASAVNGGSPVQKSRNLPITACRLVAGDDVFLFLVCQLASNGTDGRQQRLCALVDLGRIPGLPESSRSAALLCHRAIPPPPRGRQ